MPEQHTDNTPMVSVVIPSIRGGDYVSCLLGEIERQTFKDLETVVIKGVRPNGKARNEGVRKARGKYLVFIDDDVSLGHDRVIENVVSPLMQESCIGMTGASVLLPEDANWLQRASTSFRRVEFPVVKEIVDSDSAQHSCCALPKEVYTDVGWESDDLITGTDDDLRMRLHKAGYRVVVVPDTWVYHKIEDNLPSLARKLFRSGMGSAYAIKIHPEIFGYPRIDVFNYQIKTAGGALLYKIISTLVKIPIFLCTLRVLRLFAEPVYTSGYLYGWFKFKDARSPGGKAGDSVPSQQQPQLGITDRFLTLVIRTLYGLPNALLVVLRFILFRKDNFTAKGVQNILIYRTGNIGDIVCAVPSILAVRRQFPTARITLLTTPGRRGLPDGSEILSNAWYLDDIKLYYPEDFRGIRKVYDQVKELRREHYDLFIALSYGREGFFTLFKKMLFAKALGVSGVIGFRVRIITLFARIQSRLLPAEGEVESLLNALQSDGIAVNGVEFDLPITEDDVKVVDRYLLVSSSEEEKSLTVAIHPGAKKKNSQWPVERFVEVGKRLREKFGVRIVVTGGPHDTEKAAYLKNSIGDKVIITAGKTRVLQTAEVLKRCDLLISNDTGATHLAAAVGTPVVAIFRPWQIKGQWHPYGNGNIVLRGHAWCDSCYKRDCDDTECLESVTVDEVLCACEAVLGRLQKRDKL